MTVRTILKTTSLVALAFLAVGVAVAPASAGQKRQKPPTPQTVLYELTENMALDNLGNPTVRTATAALQGTARPGTPLCPAELLQLLVGYGLLNNTNEPCTVTAIGNDSVGLATGAGELWGTFAVVINLDNPVDAAELVVMTGAFRGTMQVLADASGQLPLIALSGGELTYETVLGVPAAAFGLTSATFNGIFRLPFVLPGEDVGSWRGPFYLGEAGMFKVKRHEYSLDSPTVRVEINWD
jgi:hypothetical protein